MKTTTMNRTDLRSNAQLPYPNAATRRELVHKFVDLLLVAAIGGGAAAILLFFMVLV